MGDKKTPEPKKKAISKDLKELGARIKSLRVAAGYSNHEIFAYENGIDRVQYGRYERGAADMQYSSLLKIIRALKVTPEEFFSEGFE